MNSYLVEKCVQLKIWISNEIQSQDLCNEICNDLQRLILIQAYLDGKRSEKKSFKTHFLLWLEIILLHPKPESTKHSLPKHTYPNLFFVHYFRDMFRLFTALLFRLFGLILTLTHNIFLYKCIKIALTTMHLVVAIHRKWANLHMHYIIDTKVHINHFTILKPVWCHSVGVFLQNPNIWLREILFLDKAKFGNSAQYLT